MTAGGQVEVPAVALDRRPVRGERADRPGQQAGQRRLGEARRPRGVPVRHDALGDPAGLVEQRQVAVAAVEELVGRGPALLAAVLLLDDADEQHDAWRARPARGPPSTSRAAAAHPVAGRAADHRREAPDGRVLARRRDDHVGVGGPGRRGAGLEGGVHRAIMPYVSRRSRSLGPARCRSGSPVPVGFGVVVGSVGRLGVSDGVGVLGAVTVGVGFWVAVAVGVEVCVGVAVCGRPSRSAWGCCSCRRRPAPGTARPACSRSPPS